MALRVDPSQTTILVSRDYSHPAPVLARTLLGCQLWSRLAGRLTAGVIVETEAYLPVDDPACHASRGPTPGNQVMFGPAGHGYVYPIHARWCFNVVCGAKGEGTAVLVRAIQPVIGLATMVQRRGISSVMPLGNGPAKLCQALAIDRTQNGSALTPHNGVWISTDRRQSIDHDTAVRVTERIGVTSAQELRLRFLLRGNRWASGPARLR